MTHERQPARRSPLPCANLYLVNDALPRAARRCFGLLPLRCKLALGLRAAAAGWGQGRAVCHDVCLLAPHTHPLPSRPCPAPAPTCA